MCERKNLKMYASMFGNSTSRHQGGERMQTYLSSLLFSLSFLPLSAKALMPVPIFVQGKKRTNTEKFSFKGGHVFRLVFIQKSFSHFASCLILNGSAFREYV